MFKNGNNSIFSSQSCVKLTSFSYGSDFCLCFPCSLGCVQAVVSPRGWGHPAQTRCASPGLAAPRAAVWTCPSLMSASLTAAAPQGPSGSSGKGLFLLSSAPGGNPCTFPLGFCSLCREPARRVALVNACCLLAGISMFALPVSGTPPA